MFLGFAFFGFLFGWMYTLDPVTLTGDFFMALIFAVIFTIFASIPSTLVLRTFDIVYVTLLYIFIRRKEGDISGKTAIPASMDRELDQAYDRARAQASDM